MFILLFCWSWSLNFFSWKSYKLNCAKIRVKWRESQRIGENRVAISTSVGPTPSQNLNSNPDTNPPAPSRPFFIFFFIIYEFQRNPNPNPNPSSFSLSISIDRSSNPRPEKRRRRGGKNLHGGDQDWYDGFSLLRWKERDPCLDQHHTSTQSIQSRGSNPRISHSHALFFVWIL